MISILVTPFKQKVLILVAIKILVMQDSFHIRIKKEYAAAVIEDLIKSDAVESIQEPAIELTSVQKLALDKELDAIKNDPSYLKKWNDVKQQFKM